MIKKWFFYGVVTLFVSLGIMSGCGEKNLIQNKGQTVENAVSIEKNEQVVTKLGMLESAVTEYEVPVIKPSILVCTGGYDADSTKEAVIVAKSLPKNFRVIDSKTGDTVLEGNIKVRDYSAGEGLLSAIADFSEIKTEGTYYIETEILGCSMEFTIQKNLFATLKQDMLQRLTGLRCSDCHSAEVAFESNTSLYASVAGGWHTNELMERDVVEGCLAVLDLLMAYEYHPKAFEDGALNSSDKNRIPDILDEAKYEMDWLFKMQNKDSGGVYNSVTLQSKAGSTEKEYLIGGTSSKATAYFCATMARFSVEYKPFDEKYSAKCLKAASLAWKCLLANKNLVSEAQMYRAATEMYFATGVSDYREVVEDYINNHKDINYDNRFEVDSALTYLSCKYSTKTGICKNLMTKLVDRTLDCQVDSLSNIYGISSTELSVSDIIRRADEFVVMDYINTSKQYDKVEKQYVCYLAGRNPESVNYLSSFLGPKENAGMLALLGRLTD